MSSLSVVMPDLPEPAQLPELALLAGLATPLWLARAEDGLVVWLNGVARALLDPDAAGGILRMTPAGPVPAATVERAVTIQGGNGRLLALTVRIGPAPGRGLVLVEAPADSAARREVVRLTEQLVALSEDDDRQGGRILRDVTGRLQAEHRAERAHRLLLDAIDSIGQGFVLYDADDRLVLFNRGYRDLKISDPDLAQPGTPFESLLRDGMRRGIYRIPPERTEAWIDERLALHRHGGPPMEAQLADGRWLRIEERRTSDGGTVGLRTDITDLKAQALELADANRRKSDYVHHLSHELRTPLTAVIGFAEILRDRLLGPPDSPRYGEAAAQIVAAGDYMLELINNLLDLARIEAGRLELHEEDCPPALIVDATLSMMAARADQSGIALSARLPDDLPVLRADPSLVRQMLTNLVGNALKFTAAGGHVTVSAERDAEDGLVLAVADDGRGMPPDRIPQALTAFAQLHDPARDPMTATPRGSGLGLPLTAALVELHGGTLAIDSAPGCGTTVRLRFPPGRAVAAGSGFPSAL